MRSRLVSARCALVVMLCTLVAGACTGSDHQSTLPTEPTLPALDATATTVAAGACATKFNVATQIVALFPPGTARNQALVYYAAMLVALATHQTTLAQTLMFRLWSLTLTQFYAGNLVGGMSGTGPTATLALGTALYCLVGLSPTGLTLGATPSSTNAIDTVLFPSSNTQTVVTPSGLAGTQIPGNTLTTPVTIAITPLPTYTFPSGPLNTNLDQYGPFFEVSVVPQQTFTAPVLVGLCLPTSDDAPPSTLLAHNLATGGIQIFQPVTPTFLECTASSGMLDRVNPFELARQGEFSRAFAGLKTAGDSICSRPRPCTPPRAPGSAERPRPSAHSAESIRRS